MARKELAEIFFRSAIFVELLEETLDRVGDIGGGAAVAYRPGDRGEFAYASADAEIVGIDHFAVELDFFALEADVGDPVLAATVGAAGDIDAELLLEAGDAVVEFAGEPARETFGFGESELAEFGASAGDRGACECGGANRQARSREFASNPDGVLVWDVYDHEILHDRVADVAVAVAVGQVGGESELCWGDASAQHVGADVGQAELLLSVNADVIAMDVGGDFFRFSGIENEADTLLEFGEEAVGGPAVLQEQEFQAGAFAVFAEYVSFAEDFGDAAGDRDDLLPWHKSSEAHGQVRICGEAAAYAYRESGFEAADAPAGDGSEANVIDLGIIAPGAAAGDGHLELAGEIVEFGVAAQRAIDIQGERRGIAEFVGVETCQRATGDVAGYITASADGGEARAPQGLDDVGECLHGDPMQLDVLADGDVGDAAGVSLGEIGDGAGLLAG